MLHKAVASYDSAHHAAWTEAVIYLFFIFLPSAVVLQWVSLVRSFPEMYHVGAIVVVHGRLRAAACVDSSEERCHILLQPAPGHTTEVIWLPPNIP
jgi:hypothetical protein